MKQIPIFRVTGTFLVLVFLCSILFGCGGTGSAADDAYLTQVTASVTEAQSLIDEMISFSNEMTEATGTFSENKDSDAYVEQCRTKLTLLEEKVAAVQELQQQIEKSGAPSSDFRISCVSFVEERFGSSLKMGGLIIRYVISGESVTFCS